MKNSSMKKISSTCILGFLLIFFTSCYEKNMVDDEESVSAYETQCFDMLAKWSEYIEGSATQYEFKNSLEQNCVLYLSKDKEFVQASRDISFLLDTLDVLSREQEIVLSLINDSGDDLDYVYSISFVFHDQWVFDSVLNSCVESFEIEDLTLEQKDGSLVTYSINRGSINAKSVKPSKSISDRSILRENYIRNEDFEWELKERISIERF